ncbi:MAG: glycosyltransferase family 2 protein [Chloroflexia bacterium]
MDTKQLRDSNRSASDALDKEAPSGDHAFNITVVIVNYNGLNVLPRCLTALAGAAAGLNLEIIVVDNGSEDGSLEWAQRQEGVRVVQIGSNIGFSRANNIGAATARGAHYLFLNTDCFMQQGSLLTLWERLNSDKNIAVVGPRLLNADGTLQRSCHNFPSPAVFFLEQSMIWHVISRFAPGRARLSRLYIAGEHNRVRDVDWLLGACLLVKGEAFAHAGGFDDSFFFYWEEADLCRELAEAGWRVVFDPSAQAVHLGGASTVDPDFVIYFFRSLYRFYRKHYTPRCFVLTRVIARLMAFFKACRLGIRALAKKGSVKGKLAANEAGIWLKVARL